MCHSIRQKEINGVKMEENGGTVDELNRQVATTSRSADPPDEKENGLEH